MGLIFKRFTPLFFIVCFFSCPSYSIDNSQYFELEVSDRQLTNPVQAWQQISGSFQDDQIFKALALTAVTQRQDNNLTSTSSLTVFGEELSFNTSIKFDPNASKGDLFAKLTGTLTSGSMSFGSVTISDIILEAVIVNQDDNKKLYARLSSTFSLGSKSATLTVSMDPSDSGVAYTGTATGTNLKLTDLFSQLSDIPILNEISIDQISIDAETVSTEVTLNGDTVDVVFPVNTDSSDNYVALVFDQLDASTFIPSAQGHMINSVSLDNALFIILPGGAANRTITASDLPGDLKTKAGWGDDESMSLSSGVNIAATVDVHESASLAGALTKVGITGSTLPLKGTLSAKTFKGMGGAVKGAASDLAAADKTSLLEGLDLSIKIPLPTVPAIGSLVTISGPAKIVINGDAQADGSLWKKLPDDLSQYAPSGDLDVSVRFSVKIKGTGNNDTLDALVDFSPHESLSLIAVQSSKWANPFGAPHLTISNGGFMFALETSKGTSSDSTGTSTEELGFYGTAKIGSHESLTISAELEKNSNGLTLNYFELDASTSIPLSDFPGLGKLPHTSKFTLSGIKISGSGVEAQTTISNKKVDAYLFNSGTEDASNWTFAIDQQNFKFTELLSALGKVSVLKKMTLPNAALIITENGLKGDRNNLPDIAKDMLDGIFGQSTVELNIPDGIGFLAAFDADNMGLIGKGLQKIGVHDDALLMGDVTGVFDGTVGIDVSLAMDTPGESTVIPKKLLSLPAGTTPAFFIKYADDEVDVGASVSFDVKAGKDTLTLATDISVDFKEEDVTFSFTGSMEGDWERPFGISGLTLSNTILTVGVDETGAVNVGFAGDDIIGSEKIKFAVDATIQLEDAMPESIAFKGSINKLGITGLLDIAETLMGLHGELGNLSVPFFEIHDASIAFATPGATDPELGLVSEGMAFSGQFYFMNKKLGQVKGSGGTAGVSIKGDIDKINLDILEFKQNNVDIEIKLEPKFVINSSIEVFGAEQDVEFDISPPTANFSLKDTLGHFGEADVLIQVEGLDLQKGTFDSDADISIVGEFTSTLVPWLKSEITEGITDLKDSATSTLNSLNSDLTDAQNKVQGLNTSIANERAADKQAKKRADNDINGLQDRVNSLLSDVNYDDHESKTCGSHWTHWACKRVWEAKKVINEGLYEVATDALDAAKDAVAAATDLDPELLTLEGEKDVATAALTIAQAAVTVAEDAEKYVLNELTSVLDKAVDDIPFEIDNAILIGDLRDETLVLDMKFTLFSDQKHEYFAIKLDDLEFDAVSFALLPAMALDHIVINALDDIDSKVGKWVSSHIATKLAEAEDAVQQEVQSEEAKYKDVLASFENNSTKFRAAFEDVTTAQTAVVASYQPSDMMPDSKTFTNTYIAVGHSRLCLGVAEDGMTVFQENCRDVNSELWSTSPLDDGYIELKSKGLCLKARTESSTEQGVPLILAECNSKDLHEQWKIVTYDGYYDSIVNRYSQKCLHFTSENANPKAAGAVWTSCLGAASQEFRDITDAERPTQHPVKAQLRSGAGSCIGVNKFFYNTFADRGKTVKGPLGMTIEKFPSDITPVEKNTMTALGEDILEVQECKAEAEEEFNYVEEVNGDIKLIHDYSGWCAYHKGNGIVAMAPCDDRSDMFWRMFEKKGGFQFQNISAPGGCLSLPSINDDPDAPVTKAALVSCSEDSSQIIDFKQP